MPLAKVLADLKRVPMQAAFSIRGNAAGVCCFQALAPGSHIIAPDICTMGPQKKCNTPTFLIGILEATFVDMTDVEKMWKGAFRFHYQSWFWVESPSNSAFGKSQILEVFSVLAKAHSCLASFVQYLMLLPVFSESNRIWSRSLVIGHSKLPSFLEP